MSLYIAGAGAAVPNSKVASGDFTRIVDTSNEWIITRTGIAERRLITDGGLTELAVAAAKEAITDAGISAGQIDMIIGATMGGDYITPSMACMVQNRLGLDTVIAMDVNAACTGFLYALDIAAAYFESGRAQTALVICAEQISKYLDFKDRSTCVLFGDGAAAVVLKAGEGLEYLKIAAKGDPTHLNIPGVRSPVPAALLGKDETREAEIPSGQKLAMNGQEIFKFAVNICGKELKQMLSARSLAADDIKYYLLHQANGRILEMVQSSLKIAKDKLPANLDKYGNTSCVSIPLLIHELKVNGRLHSGDLLALSAFGAGLTWGTALLRWR